MKSSKPGGKSNGQPKTKKSSAKPKASPDKKLTRNKSSTLLARGWTVSAARKTAMGVCAAAVVPIVVASRVESVWSAVALISLAAAAHQGWSANVYTLVSDTFPRQAVGSVIGFGGMCGAVGGMLIAKVTGYLLQTTGSYLPVFMIAGTTYLVTLAIVHVLSPRLEPARLS